MDNLLIFVFKKSINIDFFAVLVYGVLLKWNNISKINCLFIKLSVISIIIVSNDSFCLFELCLMDLKDWR